MQSCGEVSLAVRHGWDALAFNPIFINDPEEGKNSPLIILRAMLNWELWLAPKEGPQRGQGKKYRLARRPKARRKSIQHPPGRHPAVYILSRVTQGIHKSTRRINFPLEKVAQVVRYRQAMAGKGGDQTKE